MITDNIEEILNAILNGQNVNIIGSVTGTDILFFIVSLVTAFIIAKIAEFYIKKKFTHRLKKDALKFLIRVVQVTIFIIALGIAVPSFLDISITILLIGIAGAVIVMALSSQNVISNFVGGVALHYERPVSSGDYISIQDISGVVEGVKMFSTIVRTTSGVYVRIPNNQVYSNTVTNYYANVARRYEYDLGIRYQDDILKATELIRAKLDEYPYVLKYPAPDIFVSDIDANSVRIKFRVWFPASWANTRDDISLYTGILPKIKLTLEQEGIELPYSQQVLHFADSTLKVQNKGM
jgi:small-conductance mechanosensitive channel